MDIKTEIARVVEKGSADDALLLAASSSLARVKEIFLTISEDSHASFKALKYIPESLRYREIIDSASRKPEFARVIIEDIPSCRTEKIFKRAIDNKLYWAQVYIEKFNLEFPWICKLVKKQKKVSPQKSSPTSRL